MVALTVETTHDIRVRGRSPHLINTGDRIFSGALVGVTSGGLLRPWQDPSPSILSFMGIAVNIALDTAVSPATHSVLGDGDKEAEVNTEGPIVQGVAVGGAPVVGVLVYSADDNIASLTASPTPGGNPVGRIDRLHSTAAGTRFDVKLFTEEEARLNEGT